MNSPKVSLSKKRIEKIQSRLLRWYSENHRDLPWRKTSNPYYIWISEVMLQQTQVKTVIPYYENFIRRYPGLSDLADAEVQDVMKAWEGLGYYARIRNLQRAVKIVIECYQGVIPSDYDAFRQLPGVGDYIAAAVQSIAFQHPYAVVDGNVKRVLARIFEMDIPVNASHAFNPFKAIASRLLLPQHPDQFNQAIMELGAVVCKPRNPECSACPLSDECLAQKNSTTHEFPKRLPKKSIPQYHVAAAVIIRNQKMLITLRKPDGLLGNLWEFPGGKIKEDETAVEACVREIREETNLVIRVVNKLTQVKHAYSHFKIIMDVFHCQYIRGNIRLNGPVDYRWITLEEMEAFPFSGADLKFIPYLKEQFSALM